MSVFHIVSLSAESSVSGTTVHHCWAVTCSSKLGTGSGATTSAFVRTQQGKRNPASPSSRSDHSCVTTNEYATICASWVEIFETKHQRNTQLILHLVLPSLNAQGGAPGLVALASPKWTSEILKPSSSLQKQQLAVATPATPITWQ
eukprot:3119671-Amphidinium_carterae.1